MTCYRIKGHLMVAVFCLLFELTKIDYQFVLLIINFRLGCDLTSNGYIFHLQISSLDENSDILLEKYAELFHECGFTKILSNTTKQAAVAAIKVHYLFNRFLPATLQFKEGTLYTIFYDAFFLVR